jgi:putative membrane protein
VWLLLVPIVLTTFVVPPPLGANGATPEAVAATEPQRRPFPPLPAGRAPTVSLPDVLMRAATDSTDSLDGRLITLTGFTLKYPDSTDLGRVVIVCCAADAQLARIHLSGPALGIAAGYPEDTWLQVEGTVTPGTSTPETNFIPTLELTSVRRIDKPANTYAY